MGNCWRWCTLTWGDNDFSGKFLWFSGIWLSQWPMLFVVPVPKARRPGVFFFKSWKVHWFWLWFWEGLWLNLSRRFFNTMSVVGIFPPGNLFWTGYFRPAECDCHSALLRFATLWGDLETKPNSPMSRLLFSLKTRRKSGPKLLKLFFHTVPIS